MCTCRLSGAPRTSLSDGELINLHAGQAADRRRKRSIKFKVQIAERKEDNAVEAARTELEDAKRKFKVHIAERTVAKVEASAATARGDALEGGDSLALAQPRPPGAATWHSCRAALDI